MALSGTFNSNTTVGGSYTRLDWSATQSIAGNYSVVTANLYLVLTGGTSTNATETGNITIDGTVYGFNNGNQVRGTNSTTLIASASKTVNHNADGTKSFSISTSFTSGWVTFGTVTGSGTFTLDTIPRYATINSFTSSAVTDVGFTLNVTVDATCDQIQYSVDNGANYTTVAGDFTTKAIVVNSNLASNTTFPCKVIVRRKDSQLTTTSSVLNVTTLAQDNFMGFFD